MRRVIYTSIDDFWYWVNERHDIHIRRSSGMDWPWTSDPVLRDYRFTQVFRQLDRGTILCWKYMDGVKPEYLKIFNMFVYRVFNKPETAVALGLPLKRWGDNERNIIRRLDKKFTSAHMQMWGDEGWNKILTEMWEDRAKIASRIAAHKSWAETYEFLRERCYNTGPFFAHQFVQDIRHVFKKPDDETFTVPGPGARRCLIWMGLSDNVDGVRYIWERQDEHRAEHVPRLEMKDVQQSLCEVQKYMKLKQLRETGKRCKVRVYPRPEA